MPTAVNFSLMDHSAEDTGTQVYVETLDNSNYDELFLAVTGKVTLLQAALLLLTDCNLIRTNASLEVDTGSGAIPATVTAQREIAVKVWYRDTVNARVGTLTIPGPKTTFYPASGTDVIPLDNVLAAAFITVFEANAVSRDGNPVEVTQIRLVGRSS